MNFNKYEVERILQIIFFTKEVDLPSTPTYFELTPASKYFPFPIKCIPMEKDDFSFLWGVGSRDLKRLWSLSVYHVGVAMFPRPQVKITRH